MDNKRYIQTTSNREKVMAFIYVLLLFVITTTICCVLLFRYNTNFTAFTQKDFVINKMKRIYEYQQVQSREVATVDSLFRRIDSFNPGITALYEENDIKYLLNEIKAIYEKNPWDNRYKVFYHTSMFYEMWFTDRNELWSKQENLSKFKANLEQCEIGLQNKKDELRSNLKR